MLNKKQIKEFEKVARPVMQFIAENCHPHVTITIDTTTAELSEGIHMFRTEDYWRGKKP